MAAHEVDCGFDETAGGRNTSSVASRMPRRFDFMKKRHIRLSHAGEPRSGSAVSFVIPRALKASPNLAE